MTRSPQVLVNVNVKRKKPLVELPDIEALIAKVEGNLAGTGRVVVRYSGAGFGYQVTGAIVGGFTPLAAAALLAAYDNAAWPVAAYMMVFAAITLVTVFVAQETHRLRMDVLDATT